MKNFGYLGLELQVFQVLVLFCDCCSCVRGRGSLVCWEAVERGLHCV